MDANTIVDLALELLDPADPMRSARRMVEVLFTDPDGRRLLHHPRGDFRQFRSNHYAYATTETIHSVVWSFLERSKQLGKKGPPVRFKPNTGRVSNVIDALAAACYLDSRIDTPAWLNDAHDCPPAIELTAVANGLLHLPTAELFYATPTYFGLSASDAVFNPDAPDPVHWLAFLKDLFGADSESIDTLQDWFGYTLSADTSHQKILLVVGPKRSGKGTIGRVLTALLGRCNVVAPTLAGLQTNFGLAPLIGKPLAIISDARLGGRADQAMIAERLLSISGEDLTTIDRKHSSAWSGRLPTRFMILTNELPRIADTSGALASRFIVLILQNSFYGKEDLGLGNRLLGELSSILNWSLVGYQRLRQRQHFLQPTTSREAVEELETLGSPVSAYVRERCRVGPLYQVPVELLYQDYRAWCENNGRREPGNKQTFGRDLRAVVPSLRMARPRAGENRVRQYEGIEMDSQS